MKTLLQIMEETLLKVMGNMIVQLVLMYLSWAVLLFCWGMVREGVMAQQPVQKVPFWEFCLKQRPHITLSLWEDEFKLICCIVVFQQQFQWLSAMVLLGKASNCSNYIYIAWRYVLLSTSSVYYPQWYGLLVLDSQLLAIFADMGYPIWDVWVFSWFSLLALKSFILKLP